MAATTNYRVDSDVATSLAGIAVFAEGAPVPPRGDVEALSATGAAA